jgi:flagellar basal-body rod protein FlgC
MFTLIQGVETTSAALAAQRTRMEVVSQNIANANTTKGPDGKPYQRRQVSFESVLKQVTTQGGATSESPTVRVASISQDTSQPRQVYLPGHPDADTSGMVAFPNINIHEEMVDLLSASRAYEANLSVMKNAREMATQTISIVRG